MTIDSKKGPIGPTGPPGPAEIAGVDLDAAAISGLTDGDIIAFRYDATAGTMVPFRFATHVAHKLTLTSNGDYVHLNLP